MNSNMTPRMPESSIPRGLFINVNAGKDSIYEVGRMIHAALAQSTRYSIDHIEIRHLDIAALHEGRVAVLQGAPASVASNSGAYSFFVFNWHHVVMGMVDTTRVRRLPGVKFTVILEVVPDWPFALCPERDFDAYLPIDPTLSRSPKHVYPLPRPLEADLILPPEEPARRDVPIIGSFGFSTPGKGFELVIEAVKREFDRAVVRLNIPHATHVPEGYRNVIKEYPRMANEGVEVQITSDYFSPRELVNWCRQNTLNCFLYTRAQAGLAATTDQAIASGRPLSVSGNETFRHIHQFLKPFPYQTLQESIARSAPKVAAMQRAWHPARLVMRFEEALEDFRILPPAVQYPAYDVSPANSFVQANRKRRVLLVSNDKKRDGIHQYGRAIATALGRSRAFWFEYREISTAIQVDRLARKFQPDITIFNFNPLTMPWVCRPLLDSISGVKLGILHEMNQEIADGATNDLFDCHLAPDPTLVLRNPYVRKMNRLIPNIAPGALPPDDIVRIGSFGFGFADKGFERMVEWVMREFDSAEILLHMPFNDYVDADGHHALATAKRCRDLVQGSGHRLSISHEFLDVTDLVNVLAQNHLNVFLYDQHKRIGISSVIDLALAARRPIALSRASMFRHMWDAPIFVEDRSLPSILAQGTAPLAPYLFDWSEDAFVFNFEKLIEEICGPQR